MPRIGEKRLMQTPDIPEVVHSLLSKRESQLERIQERLSIASGALAEALLRPDEDKTGILRDITLPDIALAGTRLVKLFRSDFSDTAHQINYESAEVAPFQSEDDPYLHVLRGSLVYLTCGNSLVARHVDAAKTKKRMPLSLIPDAVSYISGSAELLAQYYGVDLNEAQDARLEQLGN